MLSILLLLFSPVKAQSVYIPLDKLKIGLFYGSSALPTANLQNVTGYGSGYRVGFFDTNNTFTALGELTDRTITVMKDETIYISADNKYVDTDSGNGFVGSYHVQLGMVFTTFQEASAYASSVSDAFPAYINGQFFVRTGDYATLGEAQAAANAVGGSAVGGSGTCFTVTVTGTYHILFEFDVSGQYLGIEPISDNGLKTQTWFKGYKYYGSFEYRKSTGGNLTVINILPIEDYIKGVIPYEMSPTWPIEALKAQAMCARSYAFYSMGSHSSYGFDLCNTIDCQVYCGTNDATELTDRAVDETAGAYITYNGEPIQAVYHASNGGATEDSGNVWNKEVPYLRAVREDFEALTTTTYTSWGFEINLSTLTAMVRDRGNAVTQLVHAYAEYTAAGNIKRLVFVDVTGTKFTYEGEKARIFLRSSTYGVAVNSQRFIFEDKANPRVTSPSDLAAPAAGSLSGPLGTPTTGTDGSGPAIVNPFGSYVISAGSVMNIVSNKYGSSLPVLSGSGISYAQSIYASGEGGTSGTGSTSTGSTGTVNANTLTIPSSSSGTYIVRGSGNGHNVGMSQFGAKGMAEAGYTAAQIVGYYYTGINIEYSTLGY